jgi:hypothetical protein
MISLFFWNTKIARPHIPFTFEDRDVSESMGIPQESSRTHNKCSGLNTDCIAAEFAVFVVSRARPEIRDEMPSKINRTPLSNPRE